MRPPKRVHLPSGRVVALDPAAPRAPDPRAQPSSEAAGRGSSEAAGERSSEAAPRSSEAAAGRSSEPAARRTPKARLFSELVDLVARGALSITEVAPRKGAGGAGASGDAPQGKRARAEPLDLTSLDLRDFHALRALAIHAGWIAEEPVDVPCRNCDAAFTVHPCASLEIAPFVDGELDDPELDATLDVALPHPIPPVALSGGRTAREVRLRHVTVREAAPLHSALRRRRLAVSEAVVRAMGIEALGPERDARAIATALARCPDDAWEAIGDCFLRAHYSPRLGAVVLCPNCGARNDVDAPYEREFEPAQAAPESNDEVFPDFDAFAARAQASFEAVAGAAAGAVRLVVDEGVPECDDGGEPLLGSYVPPGGDPTMPVGSATVTLYFRSFRASAMQVEGEPFDWRAELDETVEHELEHHAGWRIGHDPMDDEEHSEIARERARVVGRREAVRRDVAALGADVRGFLARTWLIWLIVAAASLALSLCAK